jgi:hypothetical protein
MCDTTSREVQSSRLLMSHSCPSLLFLTLRTSCRALSWRSWQRREVQGPHPGSSGSLTSRASRVGPMVSVAPQLT